jgi:Fe-S-cluster containining protein
LPLYVEEKKADAPKSAASCTSCGLCCSYVAIEVDTPKTVKQATMMLWYVYHEGISLYVNEDEWMVQFDSTCIHLQPDYRCGVYETRPHICREFSEQDCEVNTGDDGKTFYTAADFMEHLAQTRPRVHAVVKKSFSPPAEGPRMRLTPFEHRFQAVRSRRAALGV